MPRLRAIHLVAAVVALSVYAESVSAQSCEQLLVNGVFNTWNRTYSNMSTDSWHQAWCNGTVSTSSSGSTTSGSLDVLLETGSGPPIPLGMSFSDAQSFQSMYKSLYCGTASRTTTDWSHETVIRKVADPTLLQTYLECKRVEKGGLVANFGLRADGAAVTLNLSWVPGDGARPSVLVRRVQFVPEGQLRLVSSSLKDSTVVTAGSPVSLTAERIGRGRESVAIVIDTDAGQIVREVPARPDPPTATDQLMAAMPKGTILAWNNLQVPKGWDLCDGRAGRPNLVDRFPMGVALNAAADSLGAQSGSETYSLPVSGQTHEASKSSRVTNGGSFGDAGNHFQHIHGLSGSAVSHTRPPSTRVLFIIKL